MTDIVVERLRAAGEPTRLRALNLLAHEELAVLDLCRVLDQSQPRVSRHLKLLANAGLVERFPDGAWVFYRLAADGQARRLVDLILHDLDDRDPILQRDKERLRAIHAERQCDAEDYFSRHAARWDELQAMYAAEDDVDTAILKVIGENRFQRHIDLGTGTGRMMLLLGPRAHRALGLDLSQQMLNIARSRIDAAGLDHCDLRHGDILATGLPDGFGDLVTIHQVLHYLAEPSKAVGEAVRLVAPGGRLIIVDFAPHDRESLRAQHQHQRLGFADEDIRRWLRLMGMTHIEHTSLPPPDPSGLTVKIWQGQRLSLQSTLEIRA